jgi:hypothetical protein
MTMRSQGIGRVVLGSVADRLVCELDIRLMFLHPAHGTLDEATVEQHALRERGELRQLTRACSMPSSVGV